MNPETVALCNACKGPLDDHAHDGGLCCDCAEVERKSRSIWQWLYTIFFGEGL